MKKFSILLVLVVALCALSTSVFAETNPIDFATSTLDYTSGDITVQIKANTTFTVDIAYFTILPADKTKWTITGTTPGIIASGSIGIVNNEVRVANDGMTTYNAGDVLLSFTASPAAGVDVNNTKFQLKAIDLTNSETEDSPWYTDTAVGSEMTIVKAAAETTKDVNGTYEYTYVEGASGDKIFDIWVGTYNVALEGKALQSAVVKFDGYNKEFPTQNTKWVEGEGTATFKIAILGVPTDFADKSVATATLK